VQKFIGNDEQPRPGSGENQGTCGRIFAIVVRVRTMIDRVLAASRGAALKAEIPTLTPEEWAEFIDPLESLEPHIEERETA
jgi:hypothetical protein